MGGASVSSPPWMRICSGLSWLLAAVSPLVFYVAIKRARLDEAALLLLAFAVLRAVPAVLAAKREHRLAALRLPLIAVLSAAVGFLTREPRALLVLPSFSQMAFGVVFLASLRDMPLVEHFARMKSPTLDLEHVRYCRTATIVWGVALSAAAVVGLVLAAFAPLEVWTVFTGVGSYVLIVLVFSGEYLTRKIRFREYGTSVVDALISKVFPPRPDTVVRELHLGPDESGHVDVPIPDDYVFFRGHFDRAAMLPGVVQLTEIVLPIVRRRHPELGALRQLRRVRFRRPVLPGEIIRVTLGDVAAADGEPGSDDGPGASRLEFRLLVGATHVASGAMMFDPAPEPR